MKIEMGESLIASWFKHVLECQIVQENWKVSSTWPLHDEPRCQDAYDKTFNLFKASINSKKQVKLHQFLTQAECDVFGIRFENGKMHVHAADVAFHKDKLHYKNGNIPNVIKKSVRTAICLYAFLSIEEGDIYFAAPIVDHHEYINMIAEVQNLQTIMDSLGFNFHFHLELNEDFKNNILDPVCNLSNKVADTNELFLRSLQLYELCNKKYKQSNNNNNSNSSGSTSTKSSTKNNKSQTNTKINLPSGMNSPTYARTELKRLIEGGKVSPQEIQDLQDVNVCKKLFRVGFPVILEESQPFDKDRYIAIDKFFITYNNKKYRVTNHWRSDKIHLFKDWVEKH